MTQDQVYSPTTASKPQLSWFPVPSKLLDKRRFGIKLCEVVSSRRRRSLCCWSEQEGPCKEEAANRKEPQRSRLPSELLLPSEPWASQGLWNGNWSESSGVQVASCGPSQQPVLAAGSHREEVKLLHLHGGHMSLRADVFG